MVEDLEVAARSQAASLVPAIAPQAASNSPAQTYNQAVVDAIVLSAPARAMLDHLREGKTVAEAWLDHVIAPPDLTTPVDRGEKAGLTTGEDGKDAAAQLQQATDATMADLGWLFDAMNPPRVDTKQVAQALAARMAADSVGINPPLPELVARAKQSGSTTALYVENLVVTIQDNRVVTATVDRVALTNVHESLLGRNDGKDRPLVIDVGGELQRVGGEALGRPADQVTATPEARPDPAPKQRNTASPDTGLRTDDPRHALLIVRQASVLPTEGTMKMKLDALFPL